MSIYTEKVYQLWAPHDNEAVITAYIPHVKKSDCAIVILPGGAYYFRAEHEGKGYADFFAQNGILSFVVDYRCRTHHFPTPLLDARRSIQFVRYNAKHFGIDPTKIAIMGSSAGGHLAALTSTYTSPCACNTNDEIDATNYLPNAQILCYPVIDLVNEQITHLDTRQNLLGDKPIETAQNLSPHFIATAQTPQAFIWHTFEDSAVDVRNSLQYASKLKECDVPTELHIFPKGHHGLGLANENTPIGNHVSTWTTLLLRWLRSIGYINL